MAGRRRPAHAYHHAALALDHFEARVGLAGEFGTLADMERIAAQIVAVQEGDMHRIDAALERRLPVALLRAVGYEAVRAGRGGPFEIRRRRFLRPRAHIDPDHVAHLGARIRRELDLAAEAAFGWLGWHLDALAGDVVFPAVIGAAQPVLLVAAEPQRHAAMGAELVHHAAAAKGVGKRDH